jgi:cytochrome c oxidase subunit 2
MQQYLTQASTYAGDIDGLFWLITGTVFFWFFIAQGVFFGFLIKYRRKPGQKAAYIEGKSKEEKKWITIPHFLIILCDIVLVSGAIKVWNSVKLDMPPADATIRVQARQWAWIFQHPGPDGKLDTADDIRTSDELHLQNGTTYHYELTAKDVLHSFSVPVFRLKQDAVPGRTIKGWFTTSATGEFDIQCAEMCGIGHGLMAAKLYIENADTHASWMKGQSDGSSNPQTLAAK